ncbi:phage virion morphogenesis protein [Rhodoblastus sp.]|uniref:phage virion morphogenesis protein n=1 Tax=Rhodoblastus sp. TaxID=1962975 RepID=UPI003F975ADC
MTAGLSISLEVAGLDALIARVGATGKLDFFQLLDSLGRLGVEQTRQRIEVEKTAPDGTPWKETRDGRPALFVTGTHLARSIDHAVSGMQAEWGTGWIGARVHQFGAVIKPVNGKALKFQIGGETVFRKKVEIPARPYVGVSEKNRDELETVAARFVARTFQ